MRVYIFIYFKNLFIGYSSLYITNYTLFILVLKIHLFYSFQNKGIEAGYYNTKDLFNLDISLTTIICLTFNIEIISKKILS